MTACVMLKDLKGRSFGVKTIAAELALNISQAVYEPDLVTHTPGVQNKVADVLSRRYESNKQWALPAVLKEAHPALQR